MDIKIIIEAPELVQAINNLAKGLTLGSPVLAKAPQATTCNDCNSFTPDQVLSSVGKCASESAQVSNGFVPTNQAAGCGEFQQVPQIQQPMQQPVNVPIQQPAQQINNVPVQQPQMQPVNVPIQPPQIQPPQIQPPQIQQPQIQQPQIQQPQIQQPQIQPPPVPTTTQTYCMEQLSVAATQLVDAGRRDDIVKLLASFGVPALTLLPKEQYGNFATQLRQLGAKI